MIDVVYLLTEYALNYLRQNRLSGIYDIIKDLHEENYDANKFVFVETIAESSGRCWHESWTIVKDKEDKFWLRRYEVDSSD